MLFIHYYILFYNNIYYFILLYFINIIIISLLLFLLTVIITSVILIICYYYSYHYLLYQIFPSTAWSQTSRCHPRNCCTLRRHRSTFSLPIVPLGCDSSKHKAGPGDGRMDQWPC